MRRLTGRGREAALCGAVLCASCTMDITVPVEAPPDTWNPALNDHPAGSAFQELLDGYVRQGLPGVVLFVQTPRGLWNGAAGYARVETGDPMLPTHRHHAASVTKMYTATAVMLLAEEGLIDLDAPIRDLLPSTIYRPIPNGSAATVRQLLGHRSGIPDFSGNLAYDLDSLNDPMGWRGPDDLLPYLHGQHALSEPGTSYFYSNANYVLLALIVDRVVEGGHAAVVSRRILAPLGLDATYYKNEPGYPSPPGLVNSYQDLAGDGTVMNVTDLAVHGAQVFAGNAGLIATSADFAAFIQALMGTALVGPEALEEMQDWGSGSRYGLGLSYVETPWGRGIGHGGADVGVRSEVRYFPDLDATLVLLANGGDGGVPDRLFDRLWDEAVALALGPTATPGAR